MRLENNEVIADEGKYVHAIGSEAYGTRCTMFKGESLADFEEITAEEYAKIVAEREKEFGDVVSGE